MTVKRLVVWYLVALAILVLCVGVWNFVTTFQPR
jgi:hypothetical protein